MTDEAVLKLADAIKSLADAVNKVASPMGGVQVWHLGNPQPYPSQLYPGSSPWWTPTCTAAASTTGAQ